MRKKKRIEKRKIILITLLVICIVLGYMANIVSTNRQLTVFEKAIKDSVLTVSRVLTYPVDFVNKKIIASKEKKQMYNDYTNLKNELEQIKSYKDENEELKKQLNDLKKILEIDNMLTDYDKINATIISRDLAYWNEFITIDKGENAGIFKDMPVIVNNGLIGKVVKTTAFSSTVKLLTSYSMDKISVKIKYNDDYIYGILSKYDYENDIYIIEGILENVDIEKGTIVTTTGMGDIYPSGIVIGEIVGVGTDNFDLSKVLQMKSNVDFHGINYVTVLKRGDL